MRPKSILIFERLYLASTLVAVLSTGINFLTVDASGGSTDLPGASVPEMEMIVTGTVIVLSALYLVLGFIVPLVLWQLAARRGSNVARWFIVAFAAVALIQTIGFVLVLQLSPGFAGEWTASNAAIWGSFFLYETLHFASIPFLFRADAAVWFRTRGARVEVDIFQ